MRKPTYKELLTVLHHRTVILREIRNICRDKDELLPISKLTGEAFTMGLDERQLVELFDYIEEDTTTTVGRAD